MQNTKHSSPRKSPPSLWRGLGKSILIFTGRRLIGWGTSATALGQRIIQRAETDMHSEWEAPFALLCAFVLLGIAYGAVNYWVF